MGRPRKFDWNEIRRVYALTRSYSETARIIGCTIPTVARVIDPKYREYQSRRQKETRPWVGECPGCGGPASNGRGQRHQCKACADLARTTSVREDTLRCSYCGLWLPDDDFNAQNANKARRQRHSVCRLCSSVAKRDYRAAHPEVERAAYERRKVKRRAASLDAWRVVR